VAGSTDMGLWVTKQLRDAARAVIHVGVCASCVRIEEQQVDGRQAAHRRRRHAGSRLGALHARWPALRELWLRFASPPIREAGTMGGNVANGSPIGDSAPVLMALGAARAAQGGRVRRMPLADFYVDYMKNRLEPRRVRAGHGSAAGNPASAARLQGQQALRQRHLGVCAGLRSGSSSAACRARGAAGLRRAGRDRQARRGGRGSHRRPALGRSDAAPPASPRWPRTSSR
jgi:hypothetical protein